MDIQKSNVRIADLIDLVPDSGKRMRLSNYYQRRDIGAIESWKSFAEEFAFLYSLVENVAISDKDTLYRVELMLKALKAVNDAFAKWLNTEALQHLQKKVDTLQADLDSLLKSLRMELPKEDYDRIIETWRIERGS